MMKGVLAAASLLFLMAADSAALSPEAVAFGAREGIAQASLSPNGKSVAVVVPSPGRGATVIVIALDGDQKMTPVLRADGNPDQISGCGWATDTRLVCSMYRVIDYRGRSQDFSRLVSVDAGGKDVKVLSDRGSSTALGVSAFGGSMVDYRGTDGDPDTVLMSRYYIPEETIGHLTAQRQQGLGVDEVNILSLKRRTAVQPNRNAIDFLSDGAGTVRIMAVQPQDGTGNDKGQISYFYRKPGDGSWLALSTVQMTADGRGSGFTPVAVDPALNVAYGFDGSQGRSALYKVALDGSLKRDLVYDNPQVDVDQVVQIGRQHRVVGVAFATDRRQVAYFDPEMKKLAAGLSRALPNLPLIGIVDASADESVLLIWAGSDKDPGRYFIYDKASRGLAELLPVRPQLAGRSLAEVKAITYRAADGTMIPAYLTLPPGSSGKGLPAIVMPHGGPAARDEWGFDWLSQFFAARGYAVIQPNYRGSTGYGEGWYQKNGFQSWRTAVSDVDDAGKWLVAEGIAAPGKLAIVGWSYGGYAALQSGAIEPGLFKAIVAIAPVTDLDRLREERKDYSDYYLRDAFIGRGPHVDAGSPARHADRFAAPVLLFHGDRDMNVDVGESRLMRDRLKAAGKPVDYVEFAGLDHQLPDDKARAEMLDRIDRFLGASLH